MARILIINPGSTSTKIAVYHDYTPHLVKSISHSAEALAQYEGIMAQLPYRYEAVLNTLHEAGETLDFDIILSRGGLVKPLDGGVYEINLQMVGDAQQRPFRIHACNLGLLIAHRIATQHAHCKAYIADTPLVDELCPEARITGLPELPRQPIWHALNQRATARKLSAILGGHYEDYNLIGAHLGGGISIAAHQKGRVIEVNNALDGDGPMSPERTGSLPMGAWTQRCFSGDYTPNDLRQQLVGRGGLVAHLGTNSAQEAEQRANSGDTQAMAVLNAISYQTARYIAAAAASLSGQVDAIFLTGGIAHNAHVTQGIMQRIGWIAPTHIFPGENEMEALAENANLILQGTLVPKRYI